jgi:hypothetical protein
MNSIYFYPIIHHLQFIKILLRGFPPLLHERTFIYKTMFVKKL